MVGQAPGLSGFLSARENVELGLALRGIDYDEATERAVDALAAVGLAVHAERQVELLSAGQRERVALARVFAARAAHAGCSASGGSAVRSGLMAES